MKLRIPLLLSLVLFWSVSLFSQTDVNKDIELTKVYEQVVKEGYGTPTIFTKLANEYYFQGNYIKAKQWYEKVFETVDPIDKILLFRYKQSLKALKLNFEGNPYLATGEPKEN